MTPANGKFIYCGTIVVPTTLGNITFSNGPTASTELVCTAVTSINSVRTSPHVFLNGSATIHYGTRIIDTQSPNTYAISAFNWSAGVLSCTVATLPVALIATQKVTISGASIPALNGVFDVVGAGNTTTKIDVTLASDPGSLAGVTGGARPGIIQSNGDNRGYYTINTPTISNFAATALATYAPQINPYPGPTHAVIVGATASALFGYASFDGARGRAVIPQGVPIAIDGLQSGKYFTTTAATNDVSLIAFYKAGLN